MTSFEEDVLAAEQEWVAGWKRGPVRLRWDVVPVQIDDPAPDLEVDDSSGKPVPLSSFWTDRPALLLFWRHFGCSCGMDRAARLRTELQAYLEAGANVVIVGQGEPDRAAAYKEKQELACPILCDPHRRLYQAYGLLEGTTAQVLFDAPDEFLRRDPQAGMDLMTSRRDSDRRLVDDPWQLPGEFVVASDGRLRLTYRYQYCEDYPDPRVLTSAIKLARWEKGS